MRHLDTNVVIAYLNGNVTVATRIKDHLPGVGISSLVLAELLYGARASTRVSENIERVRQLLQVVGVPVDVSDRQALLEQVVQA